MSVSFDKFSMENCNFKMDTKTIFYEYLKNEFLSKLLTARCKENVNGLNVNISGINYENSVRLSPVNISFKTDGVYIIVSSYTLAKRNNTESTSLETFLNRNFTFYKDEEEYYVSFEDSENYSGEFPTGFYPNFFAKNIQIVNVVNGKIRLQNFDFKIIGTNKVKILKGNISKIVLNSYPSGDSTAKIDNADVYYNLLNTATVADCPISLGNKIRFSNPKNIRFNEYREIEDYDLEIKVENNNLLIPSVKVVDYYDGWFSYDDRLIIFPQTIKVMKLTDKTIKDNSGGGN